MEAEVSGYHLAQINIGRLRAAVDDPMIADFVANLDRINAIADTAPGFVWRLVGEGNNATDIQPRPDDPLFAVNMSVWTGLDALAAFVYRTAHVEIMRRRLTLTGSKLRPRGHAEALEGALGHGADVAADRFRLDVNADLAGRGALGVLNGGDDARLIETGKKLLLRHYHPPEAPPPVLDECA